MSKQFQLLSAFILFILANIPSFGQPKLPYFDNGAEPCEYCQYGEWTAKKNTKILRKMNNNSNVKFSVKQGEKVTAITGVVIITKSGIGKALTNTNLEYYKTNSDNRSSVRIKKNERFYLLTYHGEGFYTVWFKGRILKGVPMSYDLVEISYPKSIWWVKIKNNKGQIGWTQMPQNFDGEHPV